MYIHIVVVGISCESSLASPVGPFFQGPRFTSPREEDVDCDDQIQLASDTERDFSIAEDTMAKGVEILSRSEDSCINVDVFGKSLGEVSA